MATVFKNILPIPSDSVQGSGSYTVPANRYGFVSMSTSAAVSRAWVMERINNADAGSGSSTSASANDNEQWLKEGDTIDTQNSNSSSTPYGRVRINSSISCISEARGTNPSSGTDGNNGSYSPVGINANGIGRAYWSVSIFPVPKKNLPAALIEGS